MRDTSRRGTVLVCVLACLGIVTAVVATATQFALRGRAEMRVQRQRIQVDYLCEAGILRAKKQLEGSADYVGEQWCPNMPESIVDRASIDIRVQKGSDMSTYVVDITARLSDRSAESLGVQKSHRIVFKNNSYKNEEPKE